MSRSTPWRSNRTLVVLAIMVLGLALRWSALTAPMALDDWDHYAMLQGIYPVKLQPLDLFNFVPDSDAARDALLETGRLPWFSSPKLHLSVLRPLASALACFEYTWLDGQHHVWRLHADSLLWLLLTLTGAAAVFFEALPFVPATLALLLYTVDDAFIWPSVWISSVNQLMSIAFVLWALWANMKARQGKPRMRVLAIALVTLGLLSGEHALAALAYLAMFELLGTSGSLATRARSTLPWLLLGLGMTVAHAGLGYGASGSSVYIAPLKDPVRYLHASAERMPKLFAECGFGIPSEWWSPWPARQLVLFVHNRLALLGISFDLERAHVAAGWLTIVLVPTACLWLSSSYAPRIEQRRELRWLLAGAFLSFAPLAATAAMSRLTVAPAFGFAAAFGWTIWKLGCAVCRSPKPALRVLAAVGAGTLIYVFVVFAGNRSYSEGQVFGRGWSPQEAARRSTEFGVPNVGGRNVFILDSPHMTVEYSLMYMLHYMRKPLARSIEVLSPAFSNSHVIERVAPNAIDIRFPEPLVGMPFRTTVYRGEDELFRQGEVVRAKRFEVTILAVSAGEPTHLRYVFPESLDDPRYVFMAPQHDQPALVPLKLPAVGESIRVLPPSFF